jgi:alkanesulfonate monooxygenase SsuD/methylene tetrahydromethanopterin reductase-like flavin-dependent oxidoreductase (luciferase family)
VNLGIFDIMQIDPTRSESIQQMFARRLDDLALCDELGFDAAFFAERHFLRNYAIPSATAWIAAASQRTSRMRIGSLGFTLPIKAPVQLAEDIAVLDQLSGGRLEVGFGLGHRIEELSALGQDPAMRVQLFQRRLAVLKALWTGGEVSMEQDDIVARSVAIYPLSLQRPHPPLWFAGTEPAAAHWMGANGLGLAVGFKPTQALAPTIGAFRAGRQMHQPAKGNDIPRPLGSIICMRNVYIADSDEQAHREIADDLVRLNELMTGDSGEAGRADRRSQADEQTRGMIRDEIMFAGGADTVTQALLAAGKALEVDTFLANVYAMGVDDERIHRTLRTLAGPVRAALASS